MSGLFLFNTNKSITSEYKKKQSAPLSLDTALEMSQLVNLGALRNFAFLKKNVNPPYMYFNSVILNR